MLRSCVELVPFAPLGAGRSGCALVLKCTHSVLWTGPPTKHSSHYTLLIVFRRRSRTALLYSHVLVYVAGAFTGARTSQLRPLTHVEVSVGLHRRGGFVHSWQRKDGRH